MRLSRASTYAIHATAYMAEHGKDRPVASHDIARARGIPERFLLKVLKPLVNHKVLVSLKGPNGGYRLGKPAAKISLLEIVEAVDGPVRVAVPFLDSTRGVPLDKKLQAIADRTAAGTCRQLQGVSIASLVSKGTKPRR